MALSWVSKKLRGTTLLFDIAEEDGYTVEVWDRFTFQVGKSKPSAADMYMGANQFCWRVRQGRKIIGKGASGDRSEARRRANSFIKKTKKEMDVSEVLESILKGGKVLNLIEMIG